VNVLLVPAHPGFPGQIPQSRKTVVVVVVGIKGSMSKVMQSFICRGCLNPVMSTGCIIVDIVASANPESVSR